MKLTATIFLNGTFFSAMIYQILSIGSTNIESTNTNFIPTGKIDLNSYVEVKIQKPIQEITHLEKPSRYRMSKIGKDFIKSHETCVLHAYNDPDPNRRSVGWGHQIRPGESLEHITRAKADELFEKDIEWVNDAINRLIAKNDSRFVYSQGFIDGLGSLIYNCGEHGVTLTEFWNRWQKCRYSKDSENYINVSDFNYTIAAVKTSRISAPGHVKRRYDEHILMLN